MTIKSPQKNYNMLFYFESDIKNKNGCVFNFKPTTRINNVYSDCDTWCHQGPRTKERKKTWSPNSCKIPKAVLKLLSQRRDICYIPPHFCTVLVCGKLVIISCSDGKCVVLGCVSDRCLWKSSSLVPKGLMCEYSWLTTAFSPWRLVFSALCQLKIQNQPTKHDQVVGWL